MTQFDSLPIINTIKELLKIKMAQVSLHSERRLFLPTKHAQNNFYLLVSYSMILFNLIDSS